MTTINDLLQTFKIWCWCMQEDKNLFNQDFKIKPAWSINPWHRASRPGAFPVFSNSSGEKPPEIYFSGHVEILQSCDTSLTTSKADSLFVAWYTLFLPNCEAIESGVIRKKRRVGQILPVKFLFKIHDSRIKCVK